VPLIWAYSGVMIFRTSKEEENWFEKWDSGTVREIGEKIESLTEERERVLVELSGGSKN